MNRLHSLPCADVGRLVGLLFEGTRLRFRRRLCGGEVRREFSRAAFWKRKENCPASNQFVRSMPLSEAIKNSISTLFCLIFSTELGIRILVTVFQ